MVFSRPSSLKLRVSILCIVWILILAESLLGYRSPLLSVFLYSEFGLVILSQLVNTPRYELTTKLAALALFGCCLFVFSWKERGFDRFLSNYVCGAALLLLGGIAAAIMESRSRRQSSEEPSSAVGPPGPRSK
jgi:hypothetical protein